MCIKIDVTSDIRKTELNPFPVQHVAEIVTLGGDAKNKARLIQKNAKKAPVFSTHEWLIYLHVSHLPFIARLRLAEASAFGLVIALTLFKCLRFVFARGRI